MAAELEAHRFPSAAGDLADNPTMAPATVYVTLSMDFRP
jgi:hypothetical protein